MKKKTSKRKSFVFSANTPGVKASTDFDGIWVRTYGRSLGLLLINKVLIPLNITANQVTIFAFLITIPAFFLFTTGNYYHTLLAGFLAFFSYFLDFVDGSLARIRKESSIYGQWLDMYLGKFGLIILFFGVTLGVYLDERTVYPWVLGFLALTAILTQGSMYNSLHRLIKDPTKFLISSKKKYGILQNIFWVEIFYYPSFFIWAIFDNMYGFLIFAAIYGWIFALGVFYKFTLQVRKQAKLK